MKTKLLEDKEIISALKNGIEYYSGSLVEKISMVEDPQVTGTYAISCYINKMTTEFLIVGFKQSMTKEEIVDNLEECEFGAFPPKSEGLKFFL